MSRFGVWLVIETRRVSRPLAKLVAHVCQLGSSRLLREMAMTEPSERCLARYNAREKRVTTIWLDPLPTLGFIHLDSLVFTFLAIRSHAPRKEPQQKGASISQSLSAACPYLTCIGGSSYCALG